MVGFCTYTEYLQITHCLNPEDYLSWPNSCREILDFLDPEYQASMVAHETLSFWMGDEGGNSIGKLVAFGM